MTTYEATIKMFDAQIATLTAERNALTDAERVTYIITCADMPIFVDGCTGELGKGVCPLRDATRFTKLRDAQALAARIVNGLGERGEVVTLGSAYNNAIDNIINVIHSIQAAGPQGE